MARPPILEYTDDPKKCDSTCFVTKIPRQVLPKEQKEKILDYLFNKDFLYLNGGIPGYPNAFTGEAMETIGNGFRDENYSWTDRLPIYIRDYDIQLPDSFVEHVEQFYLEGGKVSPCYDWKNPPKKEKTPLGLGN